jgi:hypothetical protein
LKMFVFLVLTQRKLREELMAISMSDVSLKTIKSVML